MQQPAESAVPTESVEAPQASMLLGPKPQTTNTCDSVMHVYRKMPRTSPFSTQKITKSMALRFPVKPAQEPPVADLQEDAAAPATQPVEPKACSLVVKRFVSR